MVTPEDLRILPDKPGVYLMRDAAGKIIYVGKAVSLRNRVRSYFQPSRNLNPRIEAMTRQVDRFEYIVTATEVEALVLECNLIKEERPKYNIRLRDDKQYPWVKITWTESFPQLYITRKVKHDGSKYYGPYTSVGALRDTLKTLRRIFPLRSCKYNLDREKVARPCLNYHIKRCLAPCNNGVSKEAYREMLHQVCLFLEGRQGQLIAKLEEEMRQAAAKLEYEKAAALRDRIHSIRQVLEKQKVVSDARFDADIFGIARDRWGSVVQVFQVRDGKLVGREYFPLAAGVETEASEILEAFLTQYYDGAGFIPKDILLPVDWEGRDLIGEWLRERRGGAVTLKAPQKGEKLQLTQMAMENARTLLEQERRREQKETAALDELLAELKRELELAQLPRRIECFDISNTQGREAVASMAVFVDGQPKGADYRRFRIKTIEGPNDFAMLQEAVRRRFLKGLKERENLATETGKFATFPDLLLIDGGKGQLSAVVAILEELGLTHLAVASLAKQEEEVYRPGREDPLRLSRHSAGLRLLQRVRDEAHRFAITYHKTLRDQRTIASGLDQIPGVGPAKKRLLLKHFGSVKRVWEASVAELSALPGINKELAERIKERL
ncbi:MAG: excinuclease ABC subunit UvrC [Bacillota bacterium]